MAKLILIRHGQSQWNKSGLWTGWTDIELSDQGKSEAQEAGQILKNTPIDKVYTSTLKRAKQTWEEIAKITGKEHIPTIENKNLNERDYGDYTGKNKWDIQKQVGDKKFQEIRRGFKTPIPNGETLEDVYNRVVPYFLEEILPQLNSGTNVLISAHGNSLRALVKFLDSLSDTDVEKLEIKTGEVHLYTFDTNGNVLDKEILPKHLQ